MPRGMLGNGMFILASFCFLTGMDSGVEFTILPYTINSHPRTGTDEGNLTV